jgi:hypothetical protein
MPDATNSLPSPADRSAASQYLTLTRRNLEAAVQGLTGAQWRFKPAPDRWSIAGVVDHVAMIEELIHGIVGRMENAPAAGAPDAGTDRRIREEVPRRTVKLEAPPRVQPAGSKDPEEALRQFTDGRARTLQLLACAPYLRDAFCRTLPTVPGTAISGSSARPRIRPGIPHRSLKSKRTRTSRQSDAEVKV